MLLRSFLSIRCLSTSRILARPALSEEYKSTKLWNERYKCKTLSSDDSVMKAINSKILLGEPLTNLELDIFVNVASPRQDDIEPLQEFTSLLKKLRRSIEAHTILPSTNHAVCRLFLASKRLPSLLNVLDDRINYGVFPDFFSMNLILDDALSTENYALASRAASLIMLQEEFGINQLSDMLSLYSVSKYLESNTNFDDWFPINPSDDQVLKDTVNLDSGQVVNPESNEKKKEEVENEEEDDEYIRIPFLVNPYFDNHFDITNPRVICGKTMTGLGSALSSKDEALASKCLIVGRVLQGQWSIASDLIEKSLAKNINIGSLKGIVARNIEELHGIDPPTETDKAKLSSQLSKISGDGPTLGEMAENRFNELKSQTEMKDIDDLRKSFELWSGLRSKIIEHSVNRKKSIELENEIAAKNEETRRKEEYLYFYDRLKKSNLTRIDYSN